MFCEHFAIFLQIFVYPIFGEILMNHILDYSDSKNISIPDIPRDRQARHQAALWRVQESSPGMDAFHSS